MTLDKWTRTMVAAAALGGAVCVTAPVAYADDAGAFLKRLAGEYRGRGNAKINGRDKAENVSCKISNSYDAGAKALTVTGNCASTQAKSSVSGKMTHSGDSVSGSLFTSGEASVTKSSGSVKGGKLTVRTNFVDNTTHQLTQTIQVIRHTGNGFEAEFFVYDNGQKKYEPSGRIRFSGS